LKDRHSEGILVRWVEALKGNRQTGRCRSHSPRFFLNDNNPQHVIPAEGQIPSAVAALAKVPAG